MLEPFVFLERLADGLGSFGGDAVVAKVEARKGCCVLMEGICDVRAAMVADVVPLQNEFGDRVVTCQTLPDGASHLTTDVAASKIKFGGLSVEIFILEESSVDETAEVLELFEGSLLFLPVCITPQVRVKAAELNRGDGPSVTSSRAAPCLC